MMERERNGGVSQGDTCKNIKRETESERDKDTFQGTKNPTFTIYKRHQRCHSIIIKAHIFITGNPQHTTLFELRQSEGAVYIKTLFAVRHQVTAGLV